MRRFSRSSWACIALSILLASAGPAAGGGRGEHGGGHHGGGGSQKGDGGGKSDRGGKSSGSHAGKGGHDSRKDRSRGSDSRADRRSGKRSDARVKNTLKGHGGNAGDKHGKQQKAGSRRAAGEIDRALALDIEAADRVMTAAAGASATAIAASIVESRGDRQSLVLPATLQPLPGTNIEALEERSRLSMQIPTRPTAGVSDEIVRACRVAIEAAAAPFGAMNVRVSGVGTTQRSTWDTLSAPLEVSIDYARQGGVETRHSPVTCELDAAGTVIGLT